MPPVGRSSELEPSSFEELLPLGELLRPEELLSLGEPDTAVHLVKLGDDSLQ